MRLSFVSAVVASAALAQVGANPINFDAFRLGRPAALEQRSTVHVAIVTPNNGGGGAFARVRHRCKGMKAAFKQKSIEFSNAFRQALGLATIEVIDNHHEPGRYHILKLGGSPSFVDHGRLPSPGWHNPEDHHAVAYSTFISEAKAKELDPAYQRYPPLHRPGPHVRPACRKSSFFRRIHIALTALGPWEGRVVAFVLGCGIGVLLRMVWVLAVISYRTIKGGSDEPEHEYTEIVFVEEAEEAPEAPAPAYTDEKVEAAPEVKN